MSPSVLHASGKNVRRSIQGVGHMMSTMVLNRKQSVFGAPSLPAEAGAAEPLDRSKFEENEDIVVMETKLKILEILQVPAGGREVWKWAGGWAIPLRSRCRVRVAVQPGPGIGSISPPHPLGLRNSGSWALPRLGTRTQVGPQSGL